MQMELKIDSPARDSQHAFASLPGPSAGLAIGEAAPDFSLPDLCGTPVRLSDFRGHQTLVLFWSPRCIFCQHLFPHLLVWDAQPSKDAPRLLVVSTGSVEDNQVLGLRFPVLLEQASRSIGSSFGATGTPTAVLVDAEGRIASELAAGAPAILALAPTPPMVASNVLELTIGMTTDCASQMKAEPVHPERERPGGIQEAPAQAASDRITQGVMHRREQMQPVLSYLICATPRTGSYLLCDALRSTGIAGRPEEFFNPITLAKSAKEASAATFTAYFQQVLIEGMTPNAVFGTKMLGSHLLYLDYYLRTLLDSQYLPLPELLLALFPNLRYIYLTRQDRLKQAVSLWKAMQTGVWWKMDDKASSAPASQFDMKMLDTLMQWIEADEAAWQDYFKCARVQPIEVVYEDLCYSRARFEQIIRQILYDLEIPVPRALVLPEPLYRKQADEASESWIERYLQLKHNSQLQV